MGQNGFFTPRTLKPRPKRRKRKGSSKWVRNAAKFKHYEVQNATSPIGNAKYGKYELVEKERPKLPSTGSFTPNNNKREIVPKKGKGVSVYYVAWIIGCLVVGGIVIGVLSH